MLKGNHNKEVKLMNVENYQYVRDISYEIMESRILYFFSIPYVENKFMRM